MDMAGVEIKGSIVLYLRDILPDPDIQILLRLPGHGAANDIERAARGFQPFHIALDCDSFKITILCTGRNHIIIIVLAAVVCQKVNRKCSEFYLASFVSLGRPAHGIAV